MSPEQAARGPEVVQQEILTHFEQAGHRLDREALEALVEEIALADLRHDPLAKEFGRVPLAKIEGVVVTVDHGFLELAPQQQRHVLLHEYGHSIARFLGSQAENDRYLGLNQRLSAIDGLRVSPYIAYLEQTLPDSQENASLIQEERCAEVIAQYLESDRTFTGFMKAKLLEFDTSDVPELSAHYREIIEQVRDIGEYLDFAESDADRDAFLDTHPLLREQYDLWQEMDALFEEAPWEELTTAPDDGDEGVMWDDYALGDRLSPESVPIDGRPRTIFAPTQPEQESPTPFADLITFWKVFA